MKISVNKSNWMESSCELFEIIRLMDRGLLLFQNFWALIAELVINHNYDFRIDIEIDNGTIIVEPFKNNTRDVHNILKAAELSEKSSNEELKELWKSNVNNKNIELFEAISLARRLKYLKGVIETRGDNYKIAIQNTNR